MLVFVSVWWFQSIDSDRKLGSHTTEHIPLNIPELPLFACILQVKFSSLAVSRSLHAIFSPDIHKLDEEGTLLLFDLLTESDSPRHCSTLSFEYGGVSEICWLGPDVLAVGTTRGKIIVFSIGNDNVSVLTRNPDLAHILLSEAFGWGDER